jgi:hypothetical protein
VVPTVSQARFDAILEQLNHNVKLAVGSCPPNAEGDIVIPLTDFAQMIIAAAFGLAITLGVTRAQLQHVVDECFASMEPEKKIILS